MRAKIQRRYRRDRRQNPDKSRYSFEERSLIEQAHREWQSARTLFEQVSDPELIDQAIHRMTAAEKRYVYLLKRVRSAEAEGNNVV